MPDSILESPAAAEQIRRGLIKHEAGLRALGLLYVCGALFYALAAAGIAFLIFLEQSTTPDRRGGLAELAFLIAALAGFSGLHLWIGQGLRQLDGRVRIAAILTSAVGLLGFPIITLASAYFLYLLAGAKGRRVLSPEYRTIVAATPQVRYLSPWIPVLASFC